MDPLLLRKKYRKNEVVLKLSPGAYYFRVRGIDSRKRPGEWTEVQGFSVNATIPKAKEPEHKKIFRKPLPDGKVEFNWSEGPEGTTYLIEISTKRGELVKRELYDTSFVWHPPKSGIYYWRVGHQTSSGEEWGKKRVFGVKRSALGAVVSAPVEEKEEKSEDKPEKKKRRRKLASRSELWFSLHVGQSLLFYNSEDLDVNVDASADAFVGLAGARLEYWTERMRGQTYRWRFLAEGEGLRQTLSNETFILPRFRAAGFYLLKSKRLYYGPGVKLGYATGRIFIVNTSNIIQKNVSVNRYRPGLGGFILNRVSREWAMGANAWVRYDLGGELSLIHI